MSDEDTNMAFTFMTEASYYLPLRAKNSIDFKSFKIQQTELIMIQVLTHEIILM